MRFMVMHKVDANMEAGGPPNQQVIQEMGALVQESLENGTFTSGAGLHRSARRARVTKHGNEVTVTKGPYTGKNELPGPELEGRASSERRGSQAQLGRRPLRRIQRADSRLLDPERPEPRRRHHLGGALRGDPRQQRGRRARARLDQAPRAPRGCAASSRAQWPARAPTGPRSHSNRFRRRRRG
jgi:hypothetical protein